MLSRFARSSAFERFFEHRVSQQVAHLQAHQRLSATSGGSVHDRLQAQVRSVFKFKKIFALDVDRVDECSHESSERYVPMIIAQLCDLLPLHTADMFPCRLLLINWH